MKNTVFLFLIAAATMAAQSTEAASVFGREHPQGYTIGPGVQTDGPPVSVAVMSAFINQASSLYKNVLAHTATSSDYRLAALATQTLFAHMREFGYEAQTSTNIGALPALTNTIMNGIGVGGEAAGLAVIGSYQTQLTPLTATQTNDLVNLINTNYPAARTLFFSGPGGVGESQGIDDKIVAALNGTADRIDAIRAVGTWRAGKVSPALVSDIGVADVYLAGLAYYCSRGFVTLTAIDKQGFATGVSTLLYVLAIAEPTL